jgi:hypothetical protein
MKILIFTIAILIVSTVETFACSCSPKVYAPACELVSKADAVFVGEPIDYSGGIYRFKIESAYKGVANENNEVKVYGSAGTSCEVQYSIGTKYLMFAGKSANSPNTFFTNMCSGSRVANQAEIDYLDKFSKGETETIVFGQVLQWVTRIGVPAKDESNPVEGASLVLENKTQKYRTTSDSNGKFIFKDIVDGDYKLSSQKLPFKPVPTFYDISVIKGGCQQEFVQLKAMSAIEGTLLFPDGSPAKNRRMELLRKNQSGEWYSTYYMWKQTDEKGNFRFDDLESGEYLLGYEIWGDYPDSKSPFPTHYFPGVSLRNQAKMITLSPNQTISNLILKLPDKQTKRTIKIRVIYPNGALSEKGLLQFANYNQPIGAVSPKSSENGVLNFEGSKEREFEFSARYWIEGLFSDKLITSERIKISQGGDTEVTLILSKNKDENE